jgi:hypothetical protein
MNWCERLKDAVDDLLRPSERGVTTSFPGDDQTKLDQAEWATLAGAFDLNALILELVPDVDMGTLANSRDRLAAGLRELETKLDDFQRI